MSAASVAVPVATFVAGSALTVWLQWWRDRTARQERHEEREERSAERREDRRRQLEDLDHERRERHHDRQRAYLTELQDEVLELARTATRAHLLYVADLRSARAPAPLPEDVDEGLALRTRRVYALTSRLENEEVRAMVGRSVGLAWSSAGVHHESLSEATGADGALNLELETLNDAIGRELRRVAALQFPES